VHYIVAVDAVFPAHRANEYDVWEIQTLVDAEKPIAAFEQALSFSDDATNWEPLGYRGKPTLVGVRSIHEPLDSNEMGNQVPASLVCHESSHYRRGTNFRE